MKALRLESEAFDINAEIIFRLLSRGARVAEVPSTLSTRIHGVSHLDTRREIANHIRMAIKILSWRCWG